MNFDLAGQKCLIRSGECHDHAMTKRHELLDGGGPARALPLSAGIIRAIASEWLQPVRFPGRPRTR